MVLAPAFGREPVDAENGRGHMKSAPCDDKKILWILRQRKLRNIFDRRTMPRGALWVVTNRDASADAEFFASLKKKGYDFRYVARGSGASHHLPAWYWQPRVEIEAGKPFKRFAKLLRDVTEMTRAHAFAVLAEFERDRGRELTQQEAEGIIESAQHNHPKTLSPEFIALMRDYVRQRRDPDRPMPPG